MLTKNEYEHARVVAAAAKKPLDEVIKTMTEARDVYGVSFRNYRNIRLYNYTTKTVLNNGERLKDAKEAEEQHYANVCEATGLTKAQVKQALMIYNDNPYAVVDIAQYDELKLYEIPWEEQEQYLIAIRNRRKLYSELSKSLNQIDLGNETYADIQVKLNELYENVEFTLLPSDIEEVRETIEKSCPSLLEDEEKLRKTVTDMVICKRLMGFWDFEYFMFDFMNKNIEERRKFVSNNYRTFKIMQVNDRVKSDVFDNKALTYEP
ncbi:MAG: hypothetical protein K2K42_06725, partial [Eubacterium sp.]|nr:hypothetical protein [Eubacterium sp.]